MILRTSGTTRTARIHTTITKHLMKGDGNAGKAFCGENPELSANKLYSDQNLKTLD